MNYMNQSKEERSTFSLLKYPKSEITVFPSNQTKYPESRLAYSSQLVMDFVLFCVLLVVPDYIHLYNSLHDH